MFAENYIHKNCNFPVFIEGKPEKGTGIIIVIPCMDEPDILITLSSIENCLQIVSKVEVLIVINESELADARLREVNKESYRKIIEWSSTLQPGFISYHPIYPASFPKKWAGAGLARKTGMDEAIRRFAFLNNKKGVILSLDADTSVDSNYLFEVEKYFVNNPDKIGATIKFKHQTVGLNPRQKEGIGLYETYMQYYKEAVAYTGFPFPMYTIGSAFAVIADAYVKQGGMVKRPAGEDFYFLNKLTSLGEIGEITNTCVYPSARISGRVTFGTGPNMKKWMEGDEGLKLTYNFQAFLDLKIFFDIKGQLYKIPEIDYLQFVGQLPNPIKEFLLEDDFYKQIISLNNNCSSEKSFSSRFFQIFNAFKILKFLNYSHKELYRKEKLSEQIEKLNIAVGLNNG